MDTQQCLMLETVKTLISQIEAEDIPLDYEPGELLYNQILAEIRHNYTNYEDLLSEFECPPECPLFLEEECLNKDLAHDQLKQAAKSVAEKAYQKWLENKKASK